MAWPGPTLIRPDFSTTRDPTGSESRRSLRIVSMHAARYTVTMSLFNDILSAFGVLALLLASLGTYGVIAYSVA